MSTIAINAMIVEAGRLSGIGHYARQLALWFGRLGRQGGSDHRVIVLCRSGAAHHFADLDHVEVIEVPMRGGRIERVLLEQFRLPQILRAERVDAVLNPAFTGPVRGAATVVTTVHDLYFKVIPDLMPRAQRLFLSAAVPYCCRRSTRIVTTSASTMRDLEHHYPALAGNVVVVPMANRLPSPAVLPPAPAPDGRAPFVLIVAALTGNKNPGPLVEAVALARRRWPDLRLVHVGKDPEKLLADAIQRCDAGEWTKSHSGVSDADLARFYETSLCVAIPSLAEGFGLPLLEAQAAGAPVIASDRSALPEVGGPDGALYFDATDPVSIAATIEALLASPERRQALRVAGFANQQRFSWERTARAMFGLLLHP
ncbi:glycosyltransferase family 4 protein [Sphingomonas yantingensis]|uniref:Glycosyltransferase involved in cell wall biosynthesis n=1 Tax=Sphingomonas yantingensis TaxID=1241761 RepID=A0A7W9EJF0_9SPHN|nr:glycosyltransferase family 1 protein [Sphingomonas yantingensis]MBB5700152.1 glycosyltransferase involved in cell wall biosynthesis [Sphingomonas yantingensis]